MFAWRDLIQRRPRSCFLRIEYSSIAGSHWSARATTQFLQVDHQDRQVGRRHPLDTRGLTKREWTVMRKFLASLIAQVRNYSVIERLRNTMLFQAPASMHLLFLFSYIILIFHLQL